MSDSLTQRLDELASFGTRPSRKRSFEESSETPVWNAWEGIWEESDAQFRERLKKWSMSTKGVK